MYVCLLDVGFIYLIQVDKIPKLHVHQIAVTDILMACQKYMRHKKVFSSG